MDGEVLEVVEEVTLQCPCLAVVGAAGMLAWISPEYGRAGARFCCCLRRTRMGDCGARLGAVGVELRRWEWVWFGGSLSCCRAVTEEYAVDCLYKVILKGYIT